MLEELDRALNNFFGPSGSWGRLLEGVQLLAQRLAVLGAPNAAAPAAVHDPEVQQLLQGIQGAKVDCRKESDLYYVTIERVKGIIRELATLKAKVDAIVQQKAAQLKKSNGLQALQALSNTINTFRNNINATTVVGGPHHTTHALLQ